MRRCEEGMQMTIILLNFALSQHYMLLKCWLSKTEQNCIFFSTLLLRNILTWNCTEKNRAQELSPQVFMIWQKFKLRSLGNPIRTAVLPSLHRLSTALLLLQVSGNLFWLCLFVCFSVFFLAEATYPHLFPLEFVLIQELDLILTGPFQHEIFCGSMILQPDGILYHSPPGRNLQAQPS